MSSPSKLPGSPSKKDMSPKNGLGKSEAPSKDPITQSINERKEAGSVLSQANKVKGFEEVDVFKLKLSGSGAPQVKQTPGRKKR